MTKQSWIVWLKEKEPIDLIIGIVAVLMVLYHMIYTQYLIQGSIEHQDTHLVFALLLTYLAGFKKSKKAKPLFLALIALSLVTTIYIWIFTREIEFRVGFPNTLDIFIGMILMLLTIEACRQAWGNVFAGVICLFVAYDFVGHFLPGMFYHEPFSLREIVAFSNMSFTGMFGTALSTSANYIFLFIVFGAFFEVAGTADLFLEVGKILGRKFRSGPAQTAVISSAAVGMLMGQQSADVAVIGAFTIPLMKKQGYTPEQAGGIAAAGACGAQIMPPVMGAGGFLMATFLGVPYSKVIIMAIVPALLYYLSIALTVHFMAEREKFPFWREEVNKRIFWIKGPPFFLPLALLIYLLFKGYSPMFSIFWTIVSFFVVTNIRKETRMSLSQFIRGCIQGATVGASLGVACAGIGLIMITLTITGLGPNLSGAVVEWSGGILFFALLMSAFICGILTCASPTVAAYIIVAVVVSPAIVRMGISAFQSHMFVFYFAVLSGVTPPVAMASLVASRIGGSEFWKTSWEGLKVAMGAYIVAFLFVWSPTLMLLPEAVSLDIKILIVISTILGLAVSMAFLQGWFINNLNLMGRLSLLACAVGFLGFVITKGVALLIGGGILLAAILVWQTRRRRAEFSLKVDSSISGES